MRGYVSASNGSSKSLLSTKRKLILTPTETDITGHVSDKNDITITQPHKKSGVKRNKPEQNTKKSTPKNKKQRPNKPTATKSQVCPVYCTYIYNIYIYITL